MSEMNKDFKPVTMEDAWKKAKGDGYTGTLKEFETMCGKIADEMNNKSLDPDSMEAIAGGSSIGDWFSDNWEIVVGAAGGAATAIAVATAVYYANYPKGHWIPLDPGCTY